MNQEDAEKELCFIWWRSAQCVETWFQGVGLTLLGTLKQYIPTPPGVMRDGFIHLHRTLLMSIWFRVDLLCSDCCA